MFKDLGRLNLRDINENEAKILKIFSYIDADNIESATTNIIKLLSTSNYFIREFVGKKLVEYHDGNKMDQIVLTLVGHKVYGVRAGVTFYYYYKHTGNPAKIMSILEMSWNDTPWETEQILHEIWQKHAKFMKPEILKWSDSPFEKQKALAYHGIEAVAADDPQYIIRIIEKNLDDPSLEVQKKIAHALVQSVKAKPIVCYPFIREWLINASETRRNTIFSAMKKIVNLAAHYNDSHKSNKKDEFYLLTMQAVNDWKSDPEKSVAELGKKLKEFSKNPKITDDDI